MNLRPSQNGGLAAAITALVIPVFNLLDAFDLVEASEDKQQAVTTVVGLVVALILALTGNKPDPADGGN